MTLQQLRLFNVNDGPKFSEVDYTQQKFTYFSKVAMKTLKQNLTLFYLGYLGRIFYLKEGKNALPSCFLNWEWYDNETWHTLRPSYVK